MIGKGEPYMAGPLADTLAISAFNSLKNSEKSQQVYFLSETTRRLLLHFENKNEIQNREVHEIAALCLGRIFQICPPLMILPLKNSLIKSLLEVLKNEKTRAKAQLLDALICLILALEEEIHDYGEKIIFDTLHLMKDFDPLIRKAECDLLYTLSVVVPRVVKSEASSLIAALEERKSDPNSEVKNAAALALSVIKEYKGLDFKSYSSSKKLKPNIPDSNAEIKENKSEIASKNQNEKNFLQRKHFTKWNSKPASPPHSKIEHKSIFQQPVNQEFFQNAPKEEVEIRFIGGRMRPEYTDEGEEIPKNFRQNFVQSPKKQIEHFEEVNSALPLSHNPIPNNEMHFKEEENNFIEEIILLQKEITSLKENQRKLENFVQDLKLSHSAEISKLHSVIVSLQNAFHSQNLRREQREMKEISKPVSNSSPIRNSPLKEKRKLDFLEKPEPEKQNSPFDELEKLLKINISQAFGIALESPNADYLNFLLLKKNLAIESIDTDVMESLIVRLKDLLLAGYQFPGRAISVLRRVSETNRKFSQFPCEQTFEGLKELLEKNRKSKFLSEEDGKSLFKAVSNFKKYC